MALSKYKIGELVTLVDERNNIGLKEFYGLNIRKEFMPTVANTDTLDETKYKVVRKNRFVYSGMQTGRDKCIRISMYRGDTHIIVSPAYLTFEVTATDKILPEYFYMLFLSSEKDRLGWFRSDGSIRSNLDWSVFCDFDIKLPPIEIQQKYVDIYQGMVNNQKAYERGLEDLKLVCDAMLDNLKKGNVAKKLGDILKNIDVRNKDLMTTTVVGININKELFPTVADLENTDLKKYKILCKNQFAYSPMQTGRDESIRVALYTEDNPVLVSPAYFVLQLADNEILPEYVMMWFLRSEFDRYGCFLSDGSVRASLDLNRFFEIEIPVPSSVVQKSIADIFKVYNTRKGISEQLKAQINDICPILIKGSINEAR